MEINANTSVLSRCTILKKESEIHSNYSIFNYRLRPTYDFCQAILSHGDFIEVLEPQWFRIQIGTMIQRMHQLYQ